MGSEGRRRLGRFRGSANPHDIKVLEYLAFISFKYEVDLGSLFDSVVEAWRQQRSICNSLLIECRGIFRDQAVFLITNHEKVVTQFHLPEQLLTRGDLLREFKPDMRLHSRSWKKYTAMYPH